MADSIEYVDHGPIISDYTPDGVPIQFVEGDIVRKPREVPVVKLSKAEELSKLAESMDTYEAHRVECWVCGHKCSDRDVTTMDFAKALHKSGWRYIESEKFVTIGPACPKCAKTPDVQRGD